MRPPVAEDMGSGCLLPAEVTVGPVSVRVSPSVSPSGLPSLVIAPSIPSLGSPSLCLVFSLNPDVSHNDYEFEFYSECRQLSSKDLEQL